jgi:hypothetical protein
MDDWTMMSGYGAGHLIIFAIMIAVLIYPIGRILGRLGFSPFWSVVAFIPLFNLIGLWVLAFVDWPEKGASSADR